MNLGDVVNLFRSIDRLLALEDRQSVLMAKIATDIEDLKSRVIRLESREEVVIEKARGAASAAAGQVVMASVADMARRIGRLEERSGPNLLDRPAN